VAPPQKKSPTANEPESSNITMFYIKVQLIRTLNNMNRVPKLITTSILFFHLRHSLQNGLSTSRFPIKMLYTFSQFPFVVCTHLSRLPWFDHATNTLNYLLCVPFSSLGSKYFAHHPVVPSVEALWGKRPNFKPNYNLHSSILKH
jgi:hypothetical protein